MTTTHSLTLPLRENQVRQLKAGDFVLLSGIIHTGRDAVHRHLHSGNTLTCNLREGTIYHCGPVIIRNDDHWQITAAGPTTSIREEPYMADLIAQYNFRAIIGKGGMGPQTLDACAKYGCVYLSAVGGAAQRLAKAVKQVRGVTGYEQFGAPEAVWELLVEDFPAMVTMDTHGHSLHSTIKTRSEDRLADLLHG